VPGQGKYTVNLKIYCGAIQKNPKNTKCSKITLGRVTKTKQNWELKIGNCILSIQGLEVFTPVFYMRSRKCFSPFHNFSTLLSCYKKFLPQ
jgi:hypothetical protein